MVLFFSWAAGFRGPEIYGIPGDREKSFAGARDSRVDSQVLVRRASDSSVLFDINRIAVYPSRVIRSFRCADTERIFHRETVLRFKAIERQALRKLDMLDAAPDLRTLATLPGNRLERLKGDKKNQYSMRINDQWRICFAWRDGHAYEVEIVDYH
jgi:proteic killer suppression protein